MAKNITKSPNDARAPGLAEFAKSNGIKIPLELIPEKNNISKSVVAALLSGVRAIDERSVSIDRACSDSGDAAAREQ